MTIELCFGSSCHVKGAATVHEMLENALERDGLLDKVELIGTLCLGHCKEMGANVRVDGNVITGITQANFDEFYNNVVKGPLTK